MNINLDNKTVICVDDEESVLDVYKRILSPPKDNQVAEILRLANKRNGEIGQLRSGDTKYNLLTAPSGEKALELLEKVMNEGERVAAGFFDMRMPGGMDGYETIARVRQLDVDLICAVVTAYTDRNVEEIRGLFTEEHQDELLYLKKPFTADELDQTALNMVSSWNRKRNVEKHIMAIKNQREGLKYILHSVSTLSKIPPHSLDYLISGFLFQLISIVEGKNGFVVSLRPNGSTALSNGVGRFEDNKDLEYSMNRMPEFERAFKENQVILGKKSCTIPLVIGEHRLGGAYVETDQPIEKYIEKEILEIFKNQILNLFLNSIYYREIAEKEVETITDPLTSLYNRRFITKHLKEEIVNMLDKSSKLALIMIDIDDFKDVNDKYGHEAGDQILKTVGNILRLNTRNYDLVSDDMQKFGKNSQYAIRYGGEEFCLILLDIAKASAENVGERIRKAIEEHTFQYKENKIHLTVSIGVAYSENAEDIKISGDYVNDLSTKADQALYEAKRIGKNRVISYEQNSSICVLESARA
jgi:diguanylate cyclase (GGDEF)-like protein